MGCNMLYMYIACVEVGCDDCKAFDEYVFVMCATRYIRKIELRIALLFDREISVVGKSFERVLTLDDSSVSLPTQAAVFFL